MKDFNRNIKHTISRWFGFPIFIAILEILASITIGLVFFSLCILFIVLILNPSGLLAFVCLLLVLAALGLAFRCRY